MTVPPPGPPRAAPFDRLLVVVTGSPAAADAPLGLMLLRQMRPHLELRVVHTRSSARFVTPTTLAHRSGSPTALDAWGDGPDALHVELAAWAQAVLVYPATLDYMSRLASGRGDSPSVLAIHSSRAPVVLAPGLPPGAVDGEAYRAHWETLRGWRRFAVVPPVEAVSASSGEVSRAGAGAITDCLTLLESLWEDLAAGGPGQ